MDEGREHSEVCLQGLSACPHCEAKMCDTKCPAFNWTEVSHHIWQKCIGKDLTPKPRKPRAPKANPSPKPISRRRRR